MCVAFCKQAFRPARQIDWFNHRQLLEPIADVPPVDYQPRYYQRASMA
jgi:hypothetical protein